MIENGVNICLKNVFEFLYMVCKNGYENIMRFLVKKDVNIFDCKYVYFLYWVCENGYENIV